MESAPLMHLWWPWYLSLCSVDLVMSQATAGEEEGSEEEEGEDQDINIEKEKAYLMHATSGSGMHAIEV